MALLPEGEAASGTAGLGSDPSGLSSSHRHGQKGPASDPHTEPPPPVSSRVFLGAAEGRGESGHRRTLPLIHHSDPSHYGKLHKSIHLDLFSASFSGNFVDL